MFCGNCGSKGVEGKRFCATCGQENGPVSTSEFVAVPVLLDRSETVAGGPQLDPASGTRAQGAEPGEMPSYCRHSAKERGMLGIDMHHGSDVCLGCKLPYSPESSDSRFGSAVQESEISWQQKKNRAKVSIKTWPPRAGLIVAGIAMIVIAFTIFRPNVNLVFRSTTTSAQSAAELEAHQAGQSDGSQLVQNMDDALAKDFCVRTGGSNRDWQQSSNHLTDAQANSLVQPYVDGCMQGYHDSRR